MSFCIQVNLCVRQNVAQCKILQNFPPPNGKFTQKSLIINAKSVSIDSIKLLHSSLHLCVRKHVAQCQIFQNFPSTNIKDSTGYPNATSFYHCFGHRIILVCRFRIDIEWISIVLH